ncbi:hypothetical protein B0T21DRAFT_348157 [Apiosordaria backusii]|uniref:Uncharacterized protein n=1 Tax=Apiosordaria backusii TaxID=314023 RepID=A0AA40EF29_9PEZI|nr:hypothetical protein B0T21DRAFT_348157 [Apiosordaria backusii]
MSQNHICVASPFNPVYCHYCGAPLQYAPGTVDPRALEIRSPPPLAPLPPPPLLLLPLLLLPLPLLLGYYVPLLQQAHYHLVQQFSPLKCDQKRRNDSNRAYKKRKRDEEQKRKEAERIQAKRANTGTSY